MIELAVLAVVGGLIRLLSRGDNKGDGIEGEDKQPDGDHLEGRD